MLHKPVRILVIEDDRKTAQIVAKALGEAQHHVEVAHDGESGSALAQRSGFDLLVVDVMLPRRDGFGVVEELRNVGATTPVLFLTARDAVKDRVKGLEIGGDDYLVKPFALAELRARVQSLLRRARPAEETRMNIADLAIDFVHHTVARAGQALALTPKEFQLLAYLARAHGEVVTRDDIARRAWRVDFASDTNVVDVVVRRLRAKLDDPFPVKLIQTVRGSGYALRGS